MTIKKKSDYKHNDYNNRNKYNMTVGKGFKTIVCIITDKDQKVYGKNLIRPADSCYSALPKLLHHPA